MRDPDARRPPGELPSASARGIVEATDLLRLGGGRLSGPYGLLSFAPEDWVDPDGPPRPGDRVVFVVDGRTTARRVRREPLPPERPERPEASAPPSEPTPERAAPARDRIVLGTLAAWDAALEVGTVLVTTPGGGDMTTYPFARIAWVGRRDPDPGDPVHVRLTPDGRVVGVRLTGRP